MVKDKDLHSIHPGEILREELLKTYQVTPYRLAKVVGVEEGIIEELVQEKRDITPWLSYVLGCYWGVRKNYWLDLQKHYDLEVRKSQQEVQVKQKLMAKKNDHRLSPGQKRIINDVLIQGSITTSVKWKSAYKNWEKLKWNRVN